MNATVTDLASEVQTAMTALGISQNEVARRAGIDPTILSKLLNDRATAGPSKKRLDAWLARQKRRVQRWGAQKQNGRPAVEARQPA